MWALKTDEDDDGGDGDGGDAVPVPALSDLVVAEDDPDPYGDGDVDLAEDGADGDEKEEAVGWEASVSGVALLAFTAALAAWL